MKNTLLAFVLALSAVAVGQQTTAPQPQAQPAGSQPTASQQPGAAPAAGQPGAQAQPQKKEIKDPAEYNAYISAVQQKDPAAQVSGLEAFLTQYPNSVVKEDALEALMGAYQKAGNAPKMTDAANRLLAVNPDNVRGLALLAVTERAAQKWTDAFQHATRGVQAVPKMQKPEGVSDADFQKQKDQLTAALNGIAGFSALQLKDYANAQKYLRAAVETNPNNLEDVYPLGLSYLSANPPDSVNGLFFIARAANLAPAGQAQTQITNYGKSVYTKYHGSDQGWTDLLATAKTNPLPPAGFTISKYVPPTPAEQAADLVKTKQPKEMSFAEWELVLSAGKPEDAEKVWNAIKGVPLQMEGQVLKASEKELQIAGSQDDIDQKRADIILSMSGAIPPRLMPKENSTLDFEGTPVSYTASPFVMTMEKGALLTKAAPKRSPAHPARRRPTKPQQ
jgi:tetratricopeptide (TPR) repeat protein